MRALIDTIIMLSDRSSKKKKKKKKRIGKKKERKNIYLPTPPLGQDMIQGQFLSGV